MIDKELPTILDQNMLVEDREPHSLTAIANRIEGNQKVWDAKTVVSIPVFVVNERVLFF
jgi:hypothetical protein